MAGRSRSQDVKDKWLDAFTDAHAGVYTFTSCVATADLSGDGDYKLVIADLGTGVYSMKLKTYAGTSVMSEHVLIDLPTAVVPFFMDHVEPRTPAIAVASGPAIYVYKNLKPYYKFSLPSETVDQREVELWKLAVKDELSSRGLADGIKALRNDIGERGLTVRSIKFLTLDEWDRDTFINIYESEPLKKQTVITSMTTLKRTEATPQSIDCLVVGCENGRIYFVDTEAFTVLCQGNVPSTPVFMVAAGLFAVDYRLVIVCRDCGVYALKREALEGVKPSFALSANAVGLERCGKVIIIGCDDQTLRGYNMKGKLLWRVECPSQITSLSLLDHEPKNFQAVIVALDNGLIRIYKDSSLVDEMTCKDGAIPSCVKFGNVGRESGALVIIDKQGGLSVRLLKRNAKFDEVLQTEGIISSQAPKLKVPKKTKAFVDQTLRERENAVGMHQVFQRDLFLLRLSTLRAYAGSEKPSSATNAPVAMTKEGDMMQLTAEVLGFGPRFLLKIKLKCVAAKPAIDLFLLFKFNSKAYELDQQVVPVPFLVPGVQYPYDVRITCKMEPGMADDIKALLVKSGSPTPLLTALIAMPPAEPDD